MQEMRYIKYTCTSCHAEDTVALFSHEAVPPAINCWKCHAGRQKSTEEQIHHNIGMFPPRGTPIPSGARR